MTLHKIQKIIFFILSILELNVFSHTHCEEMFHHEHHEISIQGETCEMCDTCHEHESEHNTDILPNKIIKISTVKSTTLPPIIDTPPFNKNIERGYNNQYDSTKYRKLSPKHMLILPLLL